MDVIKKHSNVVDVSSLKLDLASYAGIDEVGRGPLAGPVVAAAVVLGDHADWQAMTDSKALSEQRRETLSEYIKSNAVAWALGRCECDEIDQLNIFNASLLAMQRAFNRLIVQPPLALVDGKFSPDLGVESYAVIKGDLHDPAIGAASILAKVTRDQEMVTLHDEYPMYGFAQHKGYPTANHLQALQTHGVCIHHRKSFKPVAKLLT